MFDPIINSKLNRLLEGGGYSEENIFRWDARNGTDGLTTNTAGTYAKISNLTPTAAELEGGALNIAGLIRVDLSTDSGTIIQSDNLIVLGPKYLVIALGTNAEYPEPGIYISVGLALEMSGQENPFVTLQWETIHPIDQKYLPGVCLPVVELSTVVGAEMVALNEADSSALESAIKTKMPIVMVLHENIEGAEALWSVHAVYVDMGGMGCYIASVTTTIYQFVNEGNGWVCYKQSMV